MMVRLWVRLTLLTALLLLLPLLVISARPYDDRPLRDLLIHPDCQALCFMGITPGVTTITDAVAILQASGWVEQLNRVTSSFEPLSYYAIDWNGQQPALIDEQQRDRLVILKSTTPGSPDLVGALNLSLKPGYTVGNVYTLLGQPTYLQADARPSRQWGVILYPYLEYAANRVTFESLTTCPLGYMQFMNAPVDRVALTVWNSKGRFTITMKKLLDNPFCR